MEEKKIWHLRILTLSAEDPFQPCFSMWIVTYKLTEWTTTWTRTWRQQCSETTLTGESWFHILHKYPPWGFEPRSLMTGSKQVVHWTSETWWECRLSTGLPPSSWLRRLWSGKEDLQQGWNQDRRAVWDQVGLSHCRYDGLVTVRDKARLSRGHNDQSHQGHRCSETTLTGESRFHRSTLGIWTRVPHDGKQTGSPLDLWDMVRMQALHKCCIRIREVFLLANAKRI